MKSAVMRLKGIFLISGLMQRRQGSKNREAQKMNMCSYPECVFPYQLPIVNIKAYSNFKFTALIFYIRASRRWNSFLNFSWDSGENLFQ